MAHFRECKWSEMKNYNDMYKNLKEFEKLDNPAKKRINLEEKVHDADEI